ERHGSRVWGRLYSEVPHFFPGGVATTVIYPLSLHDALPICGDNPATSASTRAYPVSGHHAARTRRRMPTTRPAAREKVCRATWQDRKSTRLNSSHVKISYAVFCLKKKRTEQDASTVTTRA